MHRQGTDPGQAVRFCAPDSRVVPRWLDGRAHPTRGHLADERPALYAMVAATRNAAAALRTNGHGRKDRHQSNKNQIMTARKPTGVGWESWTDRQVREAEERGEFEDLPGARQPIPDLDRPFDELWWVKNKLQREGLSYMPPSVARSVRRRTTHSRRSRAPGRRRISVGSSRTSTRRSGKRTGRESEVLR